MLNNKHLEKATGPLFFLGFVASKLQYLPFAALASAFRFISFGLYLSAYSAWFAASYSQEDHEPAHKKWYGFAQIKEQFLFSSLIGFIATILCVASIFVPVLFPLAAWLFVLGNVFWTIGEYHKLNNPPKDEQFSYDQQESYVSYTVSTTLISLIGAASATVIFLFPPITVPLSIFTILLSAGFGVLAFEYLLDSTFNGGEPSSEPGPSSSSHDIMEAGLGKKLSPRNDNDYEPQQTKGLFTESEAQQQIISSAQLVTSSDKDIILTL